MPYSNLRIGTRIFDVIGIRNHIAHGYFDIDGDIVFDVVKNNLHPLSEAITYFHPIYFEPYNQP